MPEFEVFLEESINKIIANRPPNPYDELLYQLFQRMGPEFQSKNPALKKFGQNFKSKLN